MMEWDVEVGTVVEVRSFGDWLRLRTVLLQPTLPNRDLPSDTLRDSSSLCPEHRLRVSRPPLSKEEAGSSVLGGCLEVRGLGQRLDGF